MAARTNSLVVFVGCCEMPSERQSLALAKCHRVIVGILGRLFLQLLAKNQAGLHHAAVAYRTEPASS